MSKRPDELAREVYPLIPHEDWDRHQELTAQQLDRRVAFICGYEQAEKDCREEIASIKAKLWQEGYENGYLKAIDDIRKGFKCGSSEKPNYQDAMRELEEKIALVKKNGSWDGVDVDEFMSEMRGH